MEPNKAKVGEGIDDQVNKVTTGVTREVSEATGLSWKQADGLVWGCPVVSLVLTLSVVLLWRTLRRRRPS